MLGSIPSELLPTDDSGTPGSEAPVPGAPDPATARHEPAAAPPLLRDRGAALVEADPSPSTPSTRIESVIDQLAPIRSQASLASSFSREANPDDPVIRAAYACVWADLAMSVMLGTTRRARIRATMAGPRRTPIRGRG